MNRLQKAVILSEAVADREVEESAHTIECESAGKDISFPARIV